ncbi:hypothetical protein OKW43_004645 [Paraburkholderia sp. WC7.3g]
MAPALHEVAGQIERTVLPIAAKPALAEMETVSAAVVTRFAE